VPLVVIVAVATGVWDRSEDKMGTVVFNCHKIGLTFHSGLSYVKLSSCITQTMKIEAEISPRNIAGSHLSATYRVPADLNTFGGPIPNAGVSDKTLSLFDIDTSWGRCTVMNKF
jgi:hypothetical protein